MEVTVAGEADAVTGYVMDLKELNRIVESELIEKIDHKNLNMDVNFLKDINPTTENLATSFWKVIEKHINNDKRKLHSLRLFETEKNSVEYRG
jgi:6-pyruvoyltetrahydropterin/6-carboxytetrahydropterin synthase